MKLSLLALAVAAAAVPHPGVEHVVHERRDELPSQWRYAGRANPSAKIPVRIGLTQSNLENAEKYLLEVSDPKSPKYGKYYSAKEVQGLFAPSNKTVDAVTEWLQSSGISKNRIKRAPNQQWIHFDSTTGEMEKLLKAQYNLYRGQSDHKHHIATDEYSVPKHVKDHVDFIMPGVKFTEARPDAISACALAKLLNRPQPPSFDDDSQCDQFMTPSCIKDLYHIPKGKTATPGNELGVFETGDQFSQGDLNSFFKAYAHDIPQGTGPKVNSIDGGFAPVPVNASGIESSLDFELIYPLIWPQNTILYQTDDEYYITSSNATGFGNTFLEAIDGSYCDYQEPIDPVYPDNHTDDGYKGTKQCGTAPRPNVISYSYGLAESSLPVNYQRRQCLEFLKLGLQGTSVIVASGDTGVENESNEHPSGCLGEQENIFEPDTPANCPYVTSLGGTALKNGTEPSAANEVATTLFGSGGGFSNIYKRPSWQDDVVKKYFDIAKVPYKSYDTVNNESVGANEGIFNRIGRAYPDLSAISQNIVTLCTGIPQTAFGTSAATPIFASILTRINEELLARGKPTVGFVNPVLYSHPDIFNDITEGNNPGCDTPGFHAVKGWDPVTGLGTPNYQKLLELFLSIASKASS